MLKNIKFHKIPSTGSGVVPCKRKQKDMTKLPVVFRNFPNAPTNCNMCSVATLFSFRYHILYIMLIRIQPDATVCRYLFIAKSLYMFRVSQHPSSGVLKTVTTASGTGHKTGTATSVGPRWREVAVPVRGAFKL